MKKIEKKSLLLIIALALTLAFALPAMAATPFVVPDEFNSITGGGYADDYNIGFNMNKVVLDEGQYYANLNVQFIEKDYVGDMVKIHCNDDAAKVVWYQVGPLGLLVQFKTYGDVQIGDQLYENAPIIVSVRDGALATDGLDGFFLQAYDPTSPATLIYRTLPTGALPLDGGSIVAHFAK